MAIDPRKRQKKQERRAAKRKSKQRELVQAKTTGIVGPRDNAFGEPGTDQLPERVLVQVAHQFAVTPGTVFERCDGLWSDDPGQGMMLLTADCLPVAIARANGTKPALAVLHVGWRGLLGGIAAAGARTLAPAIM